MKIILKKIITILLILLIPTLLLITTLLITIESNSMQPVLNKGDMVYVQKENQYNKNDIIAFTYNNQTYIHRIIFKTNNTYRTKGDATQNLDLWTLENNHIHGKMIFKIPKIGLLKLYIANKKSDIQKNTNLFQHTTNQMIHYE